MAAEVTASGGRDHGGLTAASDGTAIQVLVDGTLDRFGRLGFAFTHAGVMGPPLPITQLSAADHNAVMNTDLRGVWLLVGDLRAA